MAGIDFVEEIELDMVDIAGDGRRPLFGRDPHLLDVVPPEDLHGNIPRLERLGGRRRFSVKETLRRRQE